MGMDVYGIEPRSAKGDYFRASVWSWHPLWELVTSACGMNEELSRAEYSQYIAEHIANTLEAQLAAGNIKKYIKDREEMLQALPLIECEICGGTGYRQPPPVCGPGHDPCNGCATTGQVKQHVTWYNMRESTVEEFAEFCRHSGGFRVL